MVGSDGLMPLLEIPDKELGVTIEVAEENAELLQSISDDDIPSRELDGAAGARGGGGWTVRLGGGRGWCC